MIVASVLIAYALVAALAGGRLLGRAQWPGRSPVLGVWAWQALTWSVTGALVMAALVLSLPVLPLRESVAEMLEACSMSLVTHYETPGGAPLAWSALAVGIVLGVGPLVAFGGELVSGVQSRRRQRASLGLVGRTDAGGVTTLDHDLPLVYCVPGRRGRIVVTTGARRCLTDRQLELVVGHEEAHLRARHHWALAGARAMRRTFGRIPLFVTAEAAIAALVEMQADDSAASDDSRRELARALLALTPHAAAPPMGVMGSAGEHSLVRARRLSMPRQRLHLRRRAAAVAIGGLALAVPVLLALGPGFESAVRDCCGAAPLVRSD